MKFSETPITLQHHLLIFKKRLIPASVIFAVISAGGFFSISLMKPTYTAEGILRFERISPLSSLTGVAKEVNSLEPLQEKSSPLSTETEVVRSIPVLQSTIAELDLRDKKGNLLEPKRFLKNLSIVSIKQADLLKVSYKDSDPSKVAKIVNTLIAKYLESNVSAHRIRATAAREFIEKQLPKAEQRVKQDENTLRRFKVGHNVVALKEEAGALVNTLKDLQQEISNAQAQLSDTNAQWAEMTRRLGIKSDQAIVSVALSQSAGVQEVLSQIQQIETELANKQTRLQSQNPEILNLRDRLAKLKGLLQKRIAKIPGYDSLETQRHLQMGDIQQGLTEEVVSLDAKRKGLKNQIDTLTKTQERYRQRTQSLPQLEAQQRELDRKLEASQATYSQLLQKIGEISIAEQQNVGNARIIESAQIPRDPSFPNQASYLAPILLGLLCAGVAVYGLEAFDQSVKNAEQAKQLLGFPLLSVIPYTDKPAKALPEAENMEYRPAGVPLIQDRSYSSMNAAYRVLHANLKFLKSDYPPRAIVITSSVPQEGKSTVTANLALAISQSNQRVLLIDADLYRPLQHQIWDTPNTLGLSDVLSHQADAASAITGIRPNLHLLPAGAIPNNSLALIDSARMASLIERLSADYDFVLIDTPPLTMTTEALILGKMADGIMFVIRPGLVDQESAKYAKGLLEQSNQTVLGHVVNDVAARPNRSSYYLPEYSSPT